MTKEMEIMTKSALRLGPSKHQSLLVSVLYILVSSYQVQCNQA